MSTGCQPCQPKFFNVSATEKLGSETPADCRCAGRTRSLWKKTTDAFGTVYIWPGNLGEIASTVNRFALTALTALT
jgi:hypothetical protein